MAKKSVFSVFLFVITLFSPVSEALAVVRPILFPVAGKASFRNDFSEPRGGGTREHLGIDIIADKMTPVVAVADGEVTFIAIPQASWGYAITIRDNDGYSYRYLHLNNDTPGTDDGQGGPQNAYNGNLERGSKVTKGQVLGWVGDSGNAETVGSHLHFEIMDQNRIHINPYDTLLSASGGTASVSTAVIVHGSIATPQEEEKFIATRNLQEGMTDKDISVLHTELKALGYYSGTATNTYTSITREAVRKFQNDNKIFATGIADVETRNLLAVLAKPKLTTTTVSITSTTSLSLGKSGSEVTKLQTRLKELGFFTGDITGYFGSITEKAVKDFQIAKGIEPLGIVGPKTRTALNSSQTTTSPSSATFTRILQKGSRGEDVKNLQLILIKEGHLTGDATGYFGNLTFNAVVAFQNANGLDAIGIVGPKTRALLKNL